MHGIVSTRSELGWNGPAARRGIVVAAAAAMIGMAGALEIAASAERVARVTSAAAWTVAHADPVGLDLENGLVLATAALIVLLWIGSRSCVAYARADTSRFACRRAIAGAHHLFALRRAAIAFRLGGLRGP